MRPDPSNPSCAAFYDELATFSEREVRHRDDPPEWRAASRRWRTRHSVPGEDLRSVAERS